VEQGKSMLRRYAIAIAGLLLVAPTLAIDAVTKPVTDFLAK
jgi:hypothetical protein